MFSIGTKFDSASKLWSGSGAASQLFHESVTLGRALLYLLNLNPAKICQISADDGSKRTNGEIYKATLNVAVNLQKRGCSKGDVVGFVCRNSHNLTPAFLAAQFLGAPTNALDIAFSRDVVGFVCRNSHNLTPAFLAAQFLGAPTNALDIAFSRDEIAHMFRATQPKFVFCDDDMSDVVHGALTDISNNATIIILGKEKCNFTHINDLLNDKGNQMQIMNLMLYPPEVDVQSCSAIICSSGTTGYHKGVALSHECIKFHFCKPALNAKLGYATFSFSSLYWASGYIALLSSLFSLSTRIITTKPFSPEFLISIIKNYKVTMLLTPPSQATQLINCPALKEDSLASLKSYTCIGGLITIELCNRIQSYLPNGTFMNTYGMSEAGTISTLCMPSAKVSVGFLSTGVTAMIINEDGQQLGFGEIGEICVKTKSLFMGYYNNPEATEVMFDKNGWVHTGDLGYFDEDGILYLTGRKKDILKYNNYHVSPLEIEEILQNHPDVSQAVVVGIPDQIFTDLPAAVVVRKDGTSVTEEELSQFVEKAVPDYKKLRGGVYFVDKIPMTPSGKMRKHIVKDLAVDLFKLRQTKNL
uniref:Putative acyl-coa synthetase n=1 Tax=Nyssomyia neivai TaxID=330878 RepID=A0A1L8DZ97_9DIPT